MVGDMFHFVHVEQMVFHGHSEAEDEQYRFMYGEIDKIGCFTRTDYTIGISTTNVIERVPLLVIIKSKSIYRLELQ